MALFEIGFGIFIGLLFGILVIYAIMQSRLAKKAGNRANQMFDQQKEQLMQTYEHEAKNNFEKYKAEYELEVQERIKQERHDALEKSRSTLKGKIAEQMTPLLPEFISNYEPADARFIGSPIDYVIFKNMTKNGNGDDKPIEVILMEVKTGKSSLTKRENQIKKAIEMQNVRFETLRVNSDDQVEIKT